MSENGNFNKIKNLVKNYCFLHKINVYYDCLAMLPDKKRLDKMKIQNKTYLPLKDQGIKKAWSKVVIFKSKATDHFQMVIYWQNKPFAYWAVKKELDKEDLELSLHCMLNYYEGCNMEERKNSKISTSVFLEGFAGEKIKTYRRGEIEPNIY